MKTTVCLLALAVFAFVGCKAPTATVPKGSKIFFQTDKQAETFRAATLVDPTRLGPVVTLDRDLQVILP